MTFLAITQGTADWLLGKPGLMDGLFSILREEAPAFRELQQGDFAEGPVRAALSDKREVLALWNSDYLAGTGQEPWGFILLNKEGGLLAEPDIGQEVLERCIYVINQRLQGLLIEGAFIHRSYANGAHTCLAGRGSRARHFSIGYFERLVEIAKTTQKSIVCVGPLHDPGFNVLDKRAAIEGRHLTSLVDTAIALQTSNRSRPVALSDSLLRFRESLAPFTRTKEQDEFEAVQVATGPHTVRPSEIYKVHGLSYEQWTAEGGPLADAQRRILRSRALRRHPLRLVGPGGSGKTLLMQLLAVQLFVEAREKQSPVRILYVVHNQPMQQKVVQRFEVLLDQPLKSLGESQQIDVFTLSEYGRTQLEIEFSATIDPDAQEAKKFQLEQVMEAMQECLAERKDLVAGSPLLSEVQKSGQLQSVFAILLMVEISTAIKGHGLVGERKRYVQSEQNLSRLHGVLKAKEREFVFDVFTKYHSAVFETHQVLDTDDIALSLLGRLRTPLWELKRKKFGYDYIFVDETQLFNENERRVFPLLTRGTTAHVPIALALDEAQQLYGQRSAGFATLGIKDITNESLPSVHRSIRAIVRLAFFIVQRCTDLFNADFPDFTRIADVMTPDSHPLAIPPTFETAAPGALSKSVLASVQAMRTGQIRQIAVICHAEQYWDGLLNQLRASTEPIVVVEQRGEKLPSNQPLLVLARPAHVGGQEFDAVILVGLEQGLVPPRVVGNDALAAAVEQQAYREMYLSITRARFQLLVMLSHDASPTAALQDAAKQGLIRTRLPNK